MATDSDPTNEQLDQIEEHFNMMMRKDDNDEIDDSNLETSRRDGDDEEEEDDFEFSFVCGETNSPIAADDIFEDGQIRPLFHFVLHDSADHDETTSSSSSPIIRKVFIERTALAEESAVAEGPYCAWSTTTEKDKADVVDEKSSTSGPEICKKSNSTGFSKLFRFRDMLLRSYSDGRDAFVFLASHKKEDKHETITTTRTTTASIQKEKVSTKERRTSSAAPEKEKKAMAAYMMQYGRKKGGETATRRRSYLPYRQDLVGFFTNVNGMSRNVHPY